MSVEGEGGGGRGGRRGSEEATPHIQGRSEHALRWNGRRTPGVGRCFIMFLILEYELFERKFELQRDRGVR